jgi:hypothetical protein
LKSLAGRRTDETFRKRLAKPSTTSVLATKASLGERARIGAHARAQLHDLVVGQIEFHRAGVEQLGVRLCVGDHHAVEVVDNVL